MSVLLFVSLFLFTFIFNYLLLELYDKRNTSKNIIDYLNTNNIGTFQCINNNLVSYENDYYSGLKVYYYLDINNKEVTCTSPSQTSINTYIKMDCGKNNRYKSRTNSCNIAFLYAYSLLKNL